MNALLLSNSTLPGQAYFEWPRSMVMDFIGTGKNVLFIPFAGVTMSFDEYEQAVQKSLSNEDVVVKSIHHFEDKKKAVAEADAIFVGGGNTFHLLTKLYEYDILADIKSAVESGTPYVGWSAGSNVAGKSIHTTNDMPIIQPPSFMAIGLIDWVINPHYTEATIPNHGGESRLMRLKEFIEINDTPVICLPEGTALKIEKGQWILESNDPVKVLEKGKEARIVQPGPFST